MMRSFVTTLIYSAGMLVQAAFGCAGTHERGAPYPNPLHDVACDFVGLEFERGPSDTDADYVSLLAVYRFSTSSLPSPKEPLSLRFQVARSRMDELQQHLSARPHVVCSPDHERNYSARVPPFEGVAGIPER
jgi:hypothetical protein